MLTSHPDVLEAAVVAWPDEDRLTRPKAFVVLKPSGRPSEATALALREHCRNQLAAFKYPRWIEFRIELPKTATGKIQRFKLRAEAPLNETAASRVLGPKGGQARAKSMTPEQRVVIARKAAAKRRKSSS